MHVNYEGYDAKKLIAYLDSCHLDCCWLLTWEEVKPFHPYQHLSINDVIDTYKRHPSRIIPMYAPDPRNPEASTLLRYWHGQGVRGCAELKSTANWQSKETRSLLSIAQELGLPVLFHMEESKYFPHPFPTDDIITKTTIKFLRTERLYGIPKKTTNLVCDNISALKKWRDSRIIHFPGYMLDFMSLADALKDFPNLIFIGHGPLFWKGVDSESMHNAMMYPRGPIDGKGLTCKLLEKYDNLYADLSGGSGLNFLTRDPISANKFIYKFSKKLLFGSDNIGKSAYQYVDSLNLPSYIKKNIFGGNAIAIV